MIPAPAVFFLCRSKQFVLHNKSYHVIVDKPSLLLVGVHQRFIADTVDDPRNPSRSLMDLVDRFIRQPEKSETVYLAVGPTDLRTNIDGLIIKIK